MTRAAARHEILSHTADVGLRVEAPDLPALFGEAAAALAELAADVPAGARELPPERVELEAADLVGLAYEWLNELIGLAEVRRAALVEARVERLEQVPPSGNPGDEASWTWRLDGAIRLARFEDGAARPRVGVKSATYHDLRVERSGAGWTLTAYLDV